MPLQRKEVKMKANHKYLNRMTVYSFATKKSRLYAQKTSFVSELKKPRPTNKAFNTMSSFTTKLTTRQPNTLERLQE